MRVKDWMNRGKRGGIKYINWKRIFDKSKAPSGSIIVTAVSIMKETITREGGRKGSNYKEVNRGVVGVSELNELQ